MSGNTIENGPSSPSKVSVARTGRFPKRKMERGAINDRAVNQEDASSLKKNKPEETAHVSGNYARYYGYRPMSPMGSDPRLKLLDQSWFEGKKCLDIGCNSGKLTAEIAVTFKPRYMLGIDVDQTLIDKANQTSARVWRQFRMVLSSAAREAERYKTCGVLGYSIRGLPYPTNLFFRVQDAVERIGDHSFDAICCFSVTKWVHIAHGDDGLMKFFVNIRDALKPGGRFVFEPQPWRSYNKARQKTHCDLSSIHITPNEFPSLLTDTLGFKTVHSLGVPDDPSLPSGFRRPIFCAVTKSPPVLKGLAPASASASAVAHASDGPIIVG